MEPGRGTAREAMEEWQASSQSRALGMSFEENEFPALPLMAIFITISGLF